MTDQRFTATSASSSPTRRYSRMTRWLSEAGLMGQPDDDAHTVAMVNAPAEGRPPMNTLLQSVPASTFRPTVCTHCREPIEADGRALCDACRSIEADRGPHECGWRPASGPCPYANRGAR